MKIINILYSTYTKVYLLSESKDPYKNQNQMNKEGLVDYLSKLEHKKYIFNIDQKIPDEDRVILEDLLHKNFPKAEVIQTKF